MTGPLRIHLAGTMSLEHDGTLVPETRLPSRQGRLAFAMLVAERERALSKEELADELWAGEPPRAWEVALRAIVSKLRGVLAGVRLDQGSIAYAFGCYQLRLPPDAWVDLEAATDAVHRAETAFRQGDRPGAMGWALVANAIARRGFLPGEDGPWASGRRRQLRDVRIRALECRAQVQLEQGLPDEAVRDLRIVLDLEPFRETAYRLAMRAHVLAGNPAEAVRTFERCRSTIAAELGTDPSAETEA
ncbi:MAG TPA: BTAD domain-containing putative transcriptional regulator, partial [Actinomycetota bacterium]|nr:BTAD domain-containing putative transcriptional regulator [Actinomycetota bacterium]